jgi:hypothetical protein
MKLFCDHISHNNNYNKWYEQIYSPYYINSPHNSKHLFDIYTLTHIFWAIIMTVFLKLFIKNNLAIFIFVLVIKILFEIHENRPSQIIKYNRIEKDSSGNTTYRGDTLINSIGDIIGGIIGIYIGLYITNYVVILSILSILFLVITNTVGISYWSEFFGFIL